ncbi:MAG: hypothetical protein A3H96_14315 [Acidobacteria bacterium RIFCSPLOWO2_02_FULL_67_36]|nr:MAG: hypothetical protein A3H96_14315 [Acidobacteria bacterium RIFCSPLOWO2_02_FULL_67_36]OFW18403.1 MAG: hypothetical protein A3G21_07825 [Acidobacteria bacterium RIFCSPLOWO2_12_FULL_66_21]
MSTLSARAWTLAVALSVLPAVLPADQSLQVAPLSREGRVLVSFRLDNAFNEDIRTAIHSGLTISFIYDVELKRGSSLWFDRTIASEKVTAAVRYDNLARRYQVTRTQDGRIERVDATEREEDARRLLTEFDKLPLFTSEGLEPNAEYYVRVRARTSPRNASFVWPWERHDVSATAKFTFIK